MSTFTKMVNELGNSIINRAKTGQGVVRKSAEIDGIRANVEALRGKATLSPAEQNLLNSLQDKLNRVEILDLTAQALETPLGTEALAMTGGGKK